MQKQPALYAVALRFRIIELYQNTTVEVGVHERSSRSCRISSLTGTPLTSPNMALARETNGG